jgi:hypothetical protein
MQLLLRIILLEVYAGVFQMFMQTSRNIDVINLCHRLQERIFEERKEIRKILNITELWRIQLCQMK